MSHSGGILKRGFLEKRAYLPRIPLQTAHGGDNLTFEVCLTGHNHATYRVSFQVLPYQFIRIAIRRIRRQEEQLQSAAECFDERLGLFRPMSGASIRSEENSAFRAGQQPLEELNKNFGVHPA